MYGIGGGTTPTQIKRVMAFIDGKNLALRYKDMQKAGARPLNGVVEIKDTFVWKPLPPQYPRTIPNTIQVYDILRAYYYTYFTDDDIVGLKSQIKKIHYLHTGSELTLSPVVFKKLKSEVKAKGDDIALTVEALHHAYNHNTDIIHIFTGDGDYLPLIQEIKHLGVTVFVSAFSSGLNERLVLEADYFMYLDEVYFVDKKKIQSNLIQSNSVQKSNTNPI